MSIFKSSAAEFKNLKSVVTAALLIALHTVLAVFVSIQVTESLRISIAFIANVVIGCLYGPVMGLFCGAVGDIVQFVIKPTGPYFPGWTLSAALACFIYGMFFYKHFPAKKSYNKGQAIRSFLHIDIAFLVRTILAIALDIVVVNILLGTYWVNLMYGKGFWFYFSTRFAKNMIQLPINVILSYYVLAFLRDIRAKVHI
jgi:ECF transporter S component (folate family)